VQQAAIAALVKLKMLNLSIILRFFAQSDDWLIRQRLAEALGNLLPQKHFCLKIPGKDSHHHVASAANFSSDWLASTERRQGVRGAGCIKAGE